MTEFFSHFALAQIIMCALLLFPLRKQNPSITLFILLMVCSSGYLLNILVQADANSVLSLFIQIPLDALPGVFWLVSLSVFGDHIVLQRWQYIVASLTMLVPLITSIIALIFSISLQDYVAIYGLIKYGMLLLELVLIFHALATSIQHWRDDLVQERRYIRGGIITVSSLYIISVIVLKQLLNIEWAGLEVVTSMLLAILITGINFLLFQLKQSSLFETVTSNIVSIINKSPESKHSKDLVRILESMEQDKLYQQDGLTISGLAKHLAIHEYKLRNLINGELNYRNFNDFLNFYRIKEVTESLVSPSFSHLPVLTLALESGFRSLSSFNKAFKNTHGMTPTAFRKKNIINAA